MDKKVSYTEEVHAERINIMKEIKELRGLEEPQENENYREPLSIETKIEKRILLSWGGPEDGFKLYFNVEKELLGGVYYRAEWGTYKESLLSGDEAKMVYEFYMGGYYE